MKQVLEVRNLTTSFLTRSGQLPAVRGIDLSISSGETLALVGESGSGKSVTALSILRLLASDRTEIRADALKIGGIDILQLTEKQLCDVRGKVAAMVFQDPMTSLNPVLTIGRQIVEALEQHSVAFGKAAWERAAALLERVKLPDARRRIHDYPHQLSGGMNQRVMIAIAIACNPSLLIADEPTTALDVTIQAQILRLLREVQAEFGMGMLLITHDLGVVAKHAERVAIMYAGRKVEEGRTRDVLSKPRHPYTQGLLAATPRKGVMQRLTEIPGVVPSLNQMPAGCPFAPRCFQSVEDCAEKVPTIVGDSDRSVACFNQVAES